MIPLRLRLDRAQDGAQDGGRGVAGLLSLLLAKAMADQQLEAHPRGKQD